METDDAGSISVGVRTALDLSWKDGLDAFTCTECGRCKDACPTFLTGKPLALKWVFDDLKHHLLAKREAIVAEQVTALPALVPGVIADETLWACTTCGYCEAACPIELEHLPRFYRMRQHRVLIEGVFPRELKTVFDAYEVQSNPWGLPADNAGNGHKASMFRSCKPPKTRSNSTICSMSVRRSRSIRGRKRSQPRSSRF